MKLVLNLQKGGLKKNRILGNRKMTKITVQIVMTINKLLSLILKREIQKLINRKL